MYNNPSYSDFKITDGYHTIHLHKCVLDNNRFFKTHLQADSYQVAPGLFPVAKAASYYIYSNYLQFKWLLPSDFINLLDINRSWQLNADNGIFAYFQSHYRQIFDCHLAKVGYVYNLLPQKQRAVFTTQLNRYLIDNPDRIASLDADSSRFVQRDTRALGLIRHRRFSELDSVVDSRQRAGILELINRYHDCVLPRNLKPLDSDRERLVLVCSKPIVVGRYYYCGPMNGCSRRHQSVFVRTSKTITKQHRIYLRDYRFGVSSYSVRSIQQNWTDREVAQADGLSYSIGLVDLDYCPSRDTDVYAVELL